MATILQRIFGTNGGHKEPTREQADNHLDRTITHATMALARNLQESVDLFDYYVDPAEALLGPDGDLWAQLGTGRFNANDQRALPYTSLEDLTAKRNQCRQLAVSNEFAISGHENRVSYIVGTGHKYTASAKRDMEVGPEEIAEVQKVIDEFTKRNRWSCRQQEIVRRGDRDGEVFLRFFKRDGELFVRFVEPTQVWTPDSFRDTPGYDYGIHTEPDDVETVVGYFVDGRELPAEEIQHRKHNVDANLKRGFPTFHPCRGSLVAASKMLRNIGAVVGIQSAIAMIRKHQGATKDAINNLNASLKDASVTNQALGKTRNLQQFQPGTIIDAPMNSQYEFPSIGVDPAKAAAAVQAVLRASAARLVMPEFMLTSDASNNNYASSLVAEAPSTKNFERLQESQREADIAIIEMQIGMAAEAGRLPADVLERIEIQVAMPILVVRDQLHTVQAQSMLMDKGILSHQTMSALNNLDYEQEQENREDHFERTGETAFTNMLPPGEEDDDDDDTDPEKKAKDDTGASGKSA